MHVIRTGGVGKWCTNRQENALEDIRSVSQGIMPRRNPHCGIVHIRGDLSSRQSLS